MNPNCGCPTPSSSSVAANPAANCGATICNDAYFTLTAAARLRVLGIGVGSNCQVRLTPKRGFLFDYGDDGGQFITDAPQVTMLPVNGGTAPNFNEVASWPVLVGAVGTDPHTWRFVYAPITGAWRLESENGNFKFVSASTIPGINAVANQTTTVRDVRPFGIWAPDATIGSPAWETRRMGIFSKGLIVGYVDGDGNPWMRCLDPATDTAEYPGTFRAVTLQYQNLVEVDNTGTPVTGGLAVLDKAAVPDAVIGYFSPTTKKFYRAPAHVRQVKSQTSTATLTLTTTYQNWTGHLQFDPVAIHHKNVRIAFNVKFDDHEQLVFGIHRNGSLLFEFDFTGVSVDPNSQYHVEYLDLNVTPGVTYTYDIRGRTASGTNGTQLEFSYAFLETLSD